jgi:hypothetical protein
MVMARCDPLDSASVDRRTRLVRVAEMMVSSQPAPPLALRPSSRYALFWVLQQVSLIMSAALKIAG